MVDVANAYRQYLDALARTQAPTAFERRYEADVSASSRYATLSGGQALALAALAAGGAVLCFFTCPVILGAAATGLAVAGEGGVVAGLTAAATEGGAAALEVVGASACAATGNPCLEIPSVPAPSVRAYRGTMNFASEIENGMGSVTQRFPKYVSMDPDAAIGAVEHHVNNLPSVYRRGLQPDPGVVGAEFPESVWQQMHDEGHFLTRDYPVGYGVRNSTETQILTLHGAEIWDQYVNYGWQYPLSRR
jgi:hypothetical protein